MLCFGQARPRLLLFLWYFMLTARYLTNITGETRLRRVSFNNDLLFLYLFSWLWVQDSYEPFMLFFGQARPRLLLFLCFLCWPPGSGLIRGVERACRRVLFYNSLSAYCIYLFQARPRHLWTPLQEICSKHVQDNSFLCDHFYVLFLIYFLFALYIFCMYFVCNVMYVYIYIYIYDFYVDRQVSD